MARLVGAALSCRRGGRVVFAGLDFALEPGRALILTGPNGSGKSSLLRLMAGLLPPLTGALAWDGQAVAEDPGPWRRAIAYLGHQNAVKPALTAAANLRFWARLAGDRSPAGRVGTVLAALGLAALADLPAGYLSAGQARRLALARIALSPGPLWLLDEPTVGLDAESVGRFAALAQRHLAGGGLLAAATHLDLGLPGDRLDLADFAAPLPE